MFIATMTANPETTEPLGSTLLANLSAFQSFARSRLDDPALAADAVQESLLRALRAAPDFSEEGQTLAWFYRILRNVLIDLHRRRQTQAAAMEQFAWASADAAPDPEARRVVCGCVTGLLATLRLDYAEIIQLADLEELTQEVIATNLHLSRSNVKVRLHRARRQLRDRLEQTCQICATHGCLDCSCDVERKNR
jgi:RNA polymerase sigma factor (sigma-70 family)